MSDISKLIEALRAGSGGARSGEDNLILPLDQPLVVVDGKLMRAADAPKPAEPDAAPKPAEAAARPTERPHDRPADKPPERK